MRLGFGKAASDTPGGSIRMLYVCTEDPARRVCQRIKLTGLDQESCFGAPIRWVIDVAERGTKIHMPLPIRRRSKRYVMFNRLPCLLASPATPVLCQVIEERDQMVVVVLVGVHPCGHGGSNKAHRNGAFPTATFGGSKDQF